MTMASPHPHRHPHPHKHPHPHPRPHPGEYYEDELTEEAEVTEQVRPPGRPAKDGEGGALT